MAKWRMLGEPPLDELLEDEIMDRVISKAGLDRSELRRRLAEIARRMAERRCGAPGSRALGSSDCGAHVG
jgi:hypothetical protein